MTTSTFNKIVRTNFNLKPWILSKNTSEIVSTCIEKIYKQIPNNFKNDLMQTKIASPKPENKGPIRYFRSQERHYEPKINTPKPKNRASNITGEKLLSTVMTNSKKAGAMNFAANKKLLKSPNYKIYGSRRFGSSASSSSASIFRRFDERRRNRSHQLGQLNFLRRSIGSQSGRTNFTLHPGLAKYLVPSRNQHIQSRLGSVPQAIEVSSNIQRDLMLIDNRLKDRISLARSKLTKLSPELHEGEPKADGTLRGWNHPPAPELFFSRFNERGVANAELQEQHRKLKTVPQKGTKKLDGLTPVDDKQTTLGAKSLNKRRERGGTENFNTILKDPTPRNAHQIAAKAAIPFDRLPSRRYTSRKPSEGDTPPEVPPPAENVNVPPTSASVATAASMAATGPTPNAAHYINSRFNRSSFFNTKKY